MVNPEETFPGATTRGRSRSKQAGSKTTKGTESAPQEKKTAKETQATEPQNKDRTDMERVKRALAGIANFPPLT